VEHLNASRNEEHPHLRVLLVDDEADVLGPLSEILEGRGYTVISTCEGETAVDIASVFPPDVLITDFRLPGIDGVTVIHRVRKACPRIHVILVSGHLSPQTLRRADAEAVDRIMEKPVSIPDLLHEVDAAA
jgi:CheY-like chemotaxis protein